MIVVLGSFMILGWVSLDTFMNVWTNVFVAVVKSMVFAVIPFGFILGIITWANSLLG